MPVRRTIVMAVAAGLLFAGCASNGSSVDHGDATPGQAIQSYADAYLHGTIEQVQALGGPTCPHGGLPPDADQKWRDQQEQWATSLGVALAKVHVEGAKVRGQTATKAEAMPVYDQPESVAGNDNWIPLTKVDGHWRIADCTKLPIGGHSTPATPS